MPMTNARAAGRAGVNSRDSHMMMEDRRPIAQRTWNNDTIPPLTTRRAKYTDAIDGCSPAIIYPSIWEAIWKNSLNYYKIGRDSC
jgi:hypothetical protein